VPVKVELLAEVNVLDEKEMIMKQKETPKKHFI
jgi:hypothetical protein